ncbi:MAG: leucine-rich repeat domain-containing protein [Planctomycetota bacterium]
MPDQPPPNNGPQPNRQEANKAFARKPPRMTVLTDGALSDTKWQEESFELSQRLGPVYDILRHHNTETPMTIAVYGGWGTGKTSAMRWLEGMLKDWKEEGKPEPGKDKYTVHPVWFDAWKYHDRDDIWRGLIAEVIIASIDVKNATPQRVLDAAKNFGKLLGRSFLNVLKGITIKVGADQAAEAEFSLETLEKIIADYKETTHPEQSFLNHYEDTLKGWIHNTLGEHERMVVFIDDLDRCLPEIALQVLEALKLYLAIDKLVFVVGVDRDVIDSQVKKHYEDMELTADKSREYLAKIFQVEVSVAPSEQQVGGFFSAQIEAIDRVNDGVWSGNLGEYKSAIEEVIQDLAQNNPREVKRLLNSSLLAGLAATEIDPVNGEGGTPPRFAQGVQVFLAAKILDDFYRGSGSWLRRNRDLEMFDRWSEVVCDEQADHERLPQLRAGQLDEWESASKQSFRRVNPGIGKGALEFEQDTKETSPKMTALVKDWAAAGRDPALVLAILRDPGLQQLMRIPFSRTVAASAPVAAGGPQQSPASGFHPRLRDAIARRLRKPAEALTANDYEELQNLALSDSDLDEGRLPPLAWLTGLQKLDLDGTQVSDVSPLAGLAGLQTLELRGTQVSDVSPLAGLAGLQELYLLGTQVSDVSPLAGLTGLKTLDLDGTQVSDVSPLTGLAGLQALFLGGTQVRDISPLSGLAGLQLLHLRGTQVSDVSPLTGLAGLYVLNLEGTQVSDVSPLLGLAGLLWLDLDGTQVSDVSPLLGLSDLESLNLEGTQVSDVSPLTGLASLQALYLNGTQVSDVSPLAGLAGLKALELSGTQVSDESAAALKEALPDCDINW